MSRHSDTPFILDQALAGLRQRLPPGWLAQQQNSVRLGSTLCVKGTDGQSTQIAVVVRKSLVPRDVGSFVAGCAGEPTLLASPFLGARTRELLAKAQISFADATGNLRVVLSRPGLFLEGLGAQQDPARTPRPLQSLRGASAGRVVRALCEWAPPFGLRALAKQADISLGTLSRVINLLEMEALLARDARKQVVSVDWASLLTRWAEDYDLTTTNEMQPYLEPQGLGALWTKLSRLPRYAATSSVAGTGVAAPRLGMLYVDDPTKAANILGLVPAEAGANVWLLRPYDNVVFERTRKKEVRTATKTTSIAVVSYPQAVVDLMSSPGRGPQEAEGLVRYMERNLGEWQYGR